MTDDAAENEEKPNKKKGLLLPAALAIVLGGAGFATTYLGLWSPSAALTSSKEPHDAPAHSMAVFVPVPTLELPLPGSSHRGVVLGAMIETDQASEAEIQHLLPRVSDLFNSFLSDIDPAAFDKRGVLEIIRAELLSRTRAVLGKASVKDLLITEFRFR